MRKSSLFSSTLLSVAAALLLAGCVVATRVPIGPVFYVDRAPPAAYSEPVIVSPGSGYVWIGGHYSWTGRDYHWNRGHWTLPLRGHTHWNPGHWQRDPRGHHWVPGHWR